MRIENLRMPCLNTTMMGVLKGVCDYYDINLSTPMLYGGSGHAFLMNIHEALCPSGPYCWNRSDFYKLVRNLGVEMVDHGFFCNSSGEPERASMESILRDSLDAGIPCSLLNMENQLIDGYDETGLHTAQPWFPHDFPPAHLTFGTWEEFGGECHVNFFTFSKAEPATLNKTLADSLRYAVDLYERPSEHTSEHYGVGAVAYDRWIGAVKSGSGDSHGNWWNGTVWAECRYQASKYFEEIANHRQEVAVLAWDLSQEYSIIADSLRKASDKLMGAGEKIAILEQASAQECACIPRIADLASRLE